MQDKGFIEFGLAGIVVVKHKCVICENEMTQYRKSVFPICDECLSDLSEIIKEKRGK